MKIKSLTIYCSSSQKLENKYYEMAQKTAKIISKYDIKVIYGGGNVGLMGEIARTLIYLNRDITGIIPKFLIKKEKKNINLTKLKIVSTMSKRKELLFKFGDAFLILPGGTGTLEEASEILSWKILKLHNKPIIFLNYENFWSPLINQFNSITNNKFGNKNLQKEFVIIDKPEQLNKIFNSWKK